RDGQVVRLLWCRRTEAGVFRLSRRAAEPGALERWRQVYLASIGGCAGRFAILRGIDYTASGPHALHLGGRAYSGLVERCLRASLEYAPPGSPGPMADWQKSVANRCVALRKATSV